MLQRECRLTRASRFYGGGTPEAKTIDLNAGIANVERLQKGQENVYRKFHTAGKPGSDPILTGLYDQSLAYMKSPTSPVLEGLQGLALDYLTPGGQFNIEMTPEEIRANQQKVLGVFGSLGNVQSNQAIAADVLNRDAYQRQKLLEAVGLGQGVEGLSQASRAQSYALPESVFATGIAGFSELSKPSFQFVSDLLTFNANAENAAEIAAANKSSGTLGAAASLTGQAVGAAANAYTGGAGSAIGGAGTAAGIG